MIYIFLVYVFVSGEFLVFSLELFSLELFVPELFLELFPVPELFSVPGSFFGFYFFPDKDFYCLCIFFI